VEPLRQKLDPPRGVVSGPGRGQSRQGPVELVRFWPPPDLVPFVEHFWVVRWTLGRSLIQSTLPHPTIHWTVEGRRSEIVGITSARFVRKLHGAGRVVAAKFRPGGFRAFWNGALRSLTDRRVPAVQILGAEARGVATAIRSLDDQRAAALLCERLRAVGARRDARALRAGRIAEGIAQHPELTTVRAVCERFCLRPLALERLFRDQIGISPKWVIQRYRLHEAMERIVSSDVSFAALANELDFTDQAHFCRVFKSFVGETPSAYARRMAREQT
jgi:AraC-like DNA-binding protein